MLDPLSLPWEQLDLSSGPRWCLLGRHSLLWLATSRSPLATALLRETTWARLSQKETHLYVKASSAPVVSLKETLQLHSSLIEPLILICVALLLNCVTLLPLVESAPRHRANSWVHYSALSFLNSLFAQCCKSGTNEFKVGSSVATIVKFDENNYFLWARSMHLYLGSHSKD